MSDVVEQIRLAYERDAQSDFVARTSDELPRSYESITAEWLTAVLCSDAPDTSVESFELGPEDSGSSNRRKISVTYNEEGRAAGLPTQLFCKATHDLLNRIVLGVSGGMRCEVLFYNEVLPTADIETPRCYFANYDPESFNSMIILGDLSDTVETFCSHETPVNRARAESQMDVLAQFHSHFLRQEGRHEALKNLPTWPQFFANTLNMGMKEGSNKGFLQAEEVIPAPLYSRYSEIWPSTEASVAIHERLPQSLVHSDVHLKNWYVLPDDKMGLGDWQCCGVGHWGRDLAYTISTALTIEDRRKWEQELIAFYLEKMAEGGVQNLSFDETWTHYRQQLMTALTWWTITLTPAEGMPDMQPRDITLEFIRRITTAMDDLDTLGAF